VGWRWYRDVQRAPLYRRDLDLVAVAPDGELAAFCTLQAAPSARDLTKDRTHAETLLSP
jgi:hypothetical protein